MTTDEKFMKLALREAVKAAAKGEVPVGAVIVRDGKVISRGHNAREMRNRADSHAEMTVIGKANKKTGSWRLEDSDIYVTLEPCPMCAGALIQARIRRLVYGAGDPKAGACGSVVNIFSDGRWNHDVMVSGGVLESECSKILSDFFKDIREKKRS